VSRIPENLSGRELEDRLLSRCVALVRDGAAPAQDQREANFFRLAAMIVQFDFPDEAKRLMRATEPYFTTHPDERLEAGEVVRRGWIIGLPRLRDGLSMRLGSRAARWLA
jgi:hypothetical protein